MMKDRPGGMEGFRKLKSFFRDSWFEIPDRQSVSRYMRPRVVSNKRGQTYYINDNILNGSVESEIWQQELYGHLRKSLYFTNNNIDMLIVYLDAVSHLFNGGSG